MHLQGKCKAGDSCGRIHNPPCRFFQKGACTKGKDCSYPHHQSTAAAAAKSDDESVETPRGERRQARGRSKEKNRTRSQTPGPKAGVCRAGSWGTGCRIEGEILYRACAAPKKYQPQEEEEDDDENLSFNYMLGTATPSGNVTFGLVQTYDREITNGETLCKLEPLLRDRSYKHPAKLKKFIIEVGCRVRCRSS